jgi:hypothetical protein
LGGNNRQEKGKLCWWKKTKEKLKYVSEGGKIAFQNFIRFLCYVTMFQVMEIVQIVFLFNFTSKFDGNEVL